MNNYAMSGLAPFTSMGGGFNYGNLDPMSYMQPSPVQQFLNNAATISPGSLGTGLVPFKAPPPRMSPASMGTALMPSTAGPGMSMARSTAVATVKPPSGMNFPVAIQKGLALNSGIAPQTGMVPFSEGESDAASSAQVRMQHPPGVPIIEQQGDPKFRNVQRIPPTDKKDEKSQDEQQKINNAFDQIAMPLNSSTLFTAMGSDQATVQSQDRTLVPTQIQPLLTDANSADLYIKILNQGNVIDLAADVVTREDGEWKRMAQAVLDIQDSQQFHILRSMILSPLKRQQLQLADLQGLIAQAKQAIVAIPGVPAGVDPALISWDAVSFKTFPNALELFCNRNPAITKMVDAQNLSVVNEVERVCWETIQEKCAEFRSRTNSVADEFIPDQTLFLELQMGGGPDPDRALRVSKIGRGTLLKYLDRMQTLFVTGNLPSALQPSKVYACHDVVTATELRGSITRLAEQQVTQEATLLENENVRQRALAAADPAGDGYTKMQQASIAIKRNADLYVKRAMAIFGDDSDKPMRTLDNQLAGSSNSLAQQMEVAQHDDVETLNLEQEERALQQLSVLLSCLRQRANAVQMSDWELVTDDDFDHMEIVRFLAHTSPAFTKGSDRIYELVAVLEETFMRGHNVEKFQGKDLPRELSELILYTMNGRAKMVIKSVPLFETDLREGGSLFQILMRMILISLAQRQRVLMETNERRVKRSAVLGV